MKLMPINTNNLIMIFTFYILYLIILYLLLLLIINVFKERLISMIRA